MMRNLNLLITAIGLVFSAHVSAAVHTYQFDGAVINGTGITPSSSFATLTVDDTSNLFNLSLNNLVTLGFGPNANVTDFAVSYSAANPGVSGVSGGVNTITVTSANQPAGAFNFGFGFNAGSNELTSGESTSWTATGFDFSNLTSGALGTFALRVQGAGQGANGNGWYGATLAAVPEPETYAMLLVGLGLVGFSARRRQG
jgi:hypothetical protein